MGLCKCPKKKVTNLFCFEHRVNVCEHCLVANHSKCVVQSYLQWLQDSDYDPSCSLCQGDLTQSSPSDTIRLMCYDVFHWECLDRNAKQLPTNTAPAGYVCPKCSGPLFPASNIQSPVADALRKVLSQVNWARAGLGLPLIEEISPSVVPAKSSATEPSHSSVSLPDSNPPTYSRPSAQVPPYSSTPLSIPTHHNHSVVDINETTPIRFPSEPRKLFEGSHKSDHDVDKYKRRSAFTWLAHWFKSRERVGSQKSFSSTTRYLLIGLFLILALGTIVVIFSHIGPYFAEDDPLLDPLANPHVRINLDDAH